MDIRTFDSPPSRFARKSLQIGAQHDGKRIQNAGFPKTVIAHNYREGGVKMKQGFFEFTKTT